MDRVWFPKTVFFVTVTSYTFIVTYGIRERCVMGRINFFVIVNSSGMDSIQDPSQSEGPV
jgi:hypothetical protein